MIFIQGNDYGSFVLDGGACDFAMISTRREARHSLLLLGGMVYRCSKGSFL